VNSEFKQVQPPEGINSSKEHPLKEFFLLLIGLLLILVVAIVALSAFAHAVAPYIPFSAEQKFANAFVNIGNKKESDSDIEIEHYLQAMAEEIAKIEQLPKDMPITVHYIDADTVNAFATLGGHVFFFRGLLEQLPNENALWMVMAHEIAHIKHRHPIKALGRGVMVGSALAIVNLSIGSGVTGGALNEAGLLTVLNFSREQELQSDETAIIALAQRYGHVKGADSLFNVLANASEGNYQQPDFFSSHPHTTNRIEYIYHLAEVNNWKTTGQINELPKLFDEWIKSDEHKE